MYTTDSFVREWIVVDPKNDSNTRKHSYWSVRDRGYELRYGGSFLAAVKSRRGFGQGIGVIVNGDEDRSPGWGHPTPAREVLGCSRGTGVKNVQIPFSALESAKIDPKDIKIISNREDRWWDTCSECGREAVHSADYDYYHKYDAGDRYVGHIHKDDGTPLCNNHITEHMLDSSQKYERHIQHMFVRGQHELGAVLFKANGKYYLSSIDDNERRYRNYFLCQLPHKVNSMDQAYDSLVPKLVKTARDCGAPISRQGELFFIPTSFRPSRDQRLHEVQRGYLFDGSHYATQCLTHRNMTYVSGKISHEPKGWGRRTMHSPFYCDGDWFICVKGLAVNSWEARGWVD